jgi:NAD(P)-dependent dehydrogenase (short-subunit alcohol dehydrogenase family)
MTVRLDGRTVIVTGATAGVGRGITLALVERGARVVGTGRGADAGKQLQADVEARGGECLFVQGDVASTQDCARVIDSTRDRFGPIDVLINNAANPLPFRTVQDTTDENWKAVIDPTLDGVMRMSRAALPTMYEQDDGVILSIASIAGVHALARNAAYGAAKAAVIQLMRVIAVEAFGTGVRANTVLVGAAQTGSLVAGMIEMGRAVRGDDWLPDPETAGGALMQAVVDPEQLGRSIAVLCSEDAREITGSIVSMDRGFSAGLLTSTALYLGAAQLLPG